MQRLEWEITGHKVVAVWDSKPKTWYFIIDGRKFRFGKKHGNELIEILSILQNHAHEKVNEKVGLGDHPGSVGSGAKSRRGDQYGIC